MCNVKHYSVQLFVNISINLRHFPRKVYVLWIIIEFFLCLRCKWNKQGGISRFKMILTFLSRKASPLRFYFFRIKVTLQYSSFVWKTWLRFFKKSLVDDIFQYLSKSLNCQTLPKNGNCSSFTKNVEKQ